MAISNLLRFVPILLGTACLVGCTTTSQPVAQTGAAKKATAYYTEDTPATGSHIAKRYAVDDPNRPPDKSADDYGGAPILVDPQLARPANQGGAR
jgi:hypothetical protein